LPCVATSLSEHHQEQAQTPTVTVVFLVYNRREELRTSLHNMLVESDYDAYRVDVVVVDNASRDGSSEMVAAEYPQVRLLRRETNSGVSGFNDGFAVAQGDYVLALDDDCYLPPDGLRRAVFAARERKADLVSFGIVSAEDRRFRFDEEYPTGLLTFWGCAVLMRRPVLAALEGYDPEIFVWANELEFMMRFFDRAFRHLHLPEVLAVHMKPPVGTPVEYIRSPTYLMNSTHFAYIVGKLMQPRDAAAALVAVLATIARDAARIDRAAIKGLGASLGGFLRGLRHRRPVRSAVSQTYRRHFHSFWAPWRISRGPRQLLLALPVELVRAARGLPRPAQHGRFREHLDEHQRFYPTSAKRWSSDLTRPGPARPSLSHSSSVAVEVG